MAMNMGKIDRVARILIAALVLFAALGTGLLGSGLLFWLALIVAAIFALTAFVGNCPIYSILGIKTCQKCQ